MSKARQIYFIVALFLIINLACHSPRSVDDIQEVDLVGAWEAHYADADGIDTLILRADGTYQQVYKDANGYVYKSSWNKWYLEHLPDERLRVHLEGMRYYPYGVAIAESQEPLHLFDESDPRPLIPSEVMDGELILTVRAGAVFVPRGLFLKHLSYGDDSAQPEFTLIATPSPSTEGE